MEDLRAVGDLRASEAAAAPVPVKCLVWDLDNTLWRGTLSEDGEVELAGAVRDVVVELDSRGILQSVSSKNDHEPAWERLEKLGIAEYFVLPQIGWGPKSDSVRRIAEQLKFAPSTIAFIDDVPAERAEVAYHLPDVRCYDADQAAALVGLPEFDPVTTEDARRRRQMYQAGFRRDAAREEFAGPDQDFLRSLRLVMRIGRATEKELTRVEELTLRTSQMNATGVHYSDATLRALLADPDHEVLVVTMEDRFGQHGAVGIVLLAMHPSLWHLKLLASSCRVVSFGAGAVILRWLIDQAARNQAHLAADFRRTERNRMMEVAYRFAGLTDQACDCLVALPGARGPGSQEPGSQEPGTGDTDGVQLLHIEPVTQSAPTTMRLVAPELGVAEHVEERHA